MLVEKHRKKNQAILKYRVMKTKTIFQEDDMIYLYDDDYEEEDWEDEDYDDEEDEENLEEWEESASFVCDDCNYRWTEEDDDSDVIACPMCGSDNITKIE